MHQMPACQPTSILPVPGLRLTGSKQHATACSHQSSKRRRHVSCMCRDAVPANSISGPVLLPVMPLILLSQLEVGRPHALSAGVYAWHIVVATADDCKEGHVALGSLHVDVALLMSMCQ